MGPRRRARRAFWLRLSGTGFEVNGRILTPQRREWRDIDTFMLVAPAAHAADAVVAPGKSLAQGHESTDSSWAIGTAPLMSGRSDEREARAPPP
jgi:hypothetical protein